MKLGIVAHTSIDHIINNDLEEITVGGPTYYAGLAVKQSNIDAKLITKVGYDFKQFLSYSNELSIDKQYIIDKNTTRFMLVINDYSRRLFLLARCEDITIDDIVDMDGYIVSPIINEISIDTLNYISKNSNFTFLDPQGFVRALRGKECYIERRDIKFQNITAIKVDEEEGFALTGLNGIDALMALNTEIAILTKKDRSFMLYKDKIYSIKFDAIKPIDSTGAGDIFMGVYASSYIKDKDAIWAYASAIA
ncbi:MAG: hypothetical protein D6752_03900, partial [Candidatus Nitrosothermus koennekii]